MELSEVSSDHYVRVCRMRGDIEGGTNGKSTVRQAAREWRRNKHRQEKGPEAYSVGEIPRLSMIVMQAVAGVRRGIRAVSVLWRGARTPCCDAGSSADR